MRSNRVAERRFQSLAVVAQRCGNVLQLMFSLQNLAPQKKIQP
jgi:hypothetical protein